MIHESIRVLFPELRGPKTPTPTFLRQAHSCLESSVNSRAHSLILRDEKSRIVERGYPRYPDQSCVQMVERREPSSPDTSKWGSSKGVSLAVQVALLRANLSLLFFLYFLPRAVAPLGSALARERRAPARARPRNVSRTRSRRTFQSCGMDRAFRMEQRAF